MNSSVKWQWKLNNVNWKKAEQKQKQAEQKKTKEIQTKLFKKKIVGVFAMGFRRLDISLWHIYCWEATRYHIILKPFLLN